MHLLFDHAFCAGWQAGTVQILMRMGRRVTTSLV
jgi:hypothetical protein